MEGGALFRALGAHRILLCRHGALAPDVCCACAAPTRVPTANFGDTNPPTRVPRTLAPNAADPTGKNNLRAMQSLPMLGTPHVLHAVRARGTWWNLLVVCLGSAATVVLLRHTCAASSRDCAILWRAAACPPVEACGRALDEGSRGVLSALGTSRMPSAGAEYCSGAFAVLPLVCTLLLA